jgi:hypothetical protein
VAIATTRKGGSMAKLVPGSLINGASGSVGTTTFSHNRGGWYSKSRVAPTNPSSTAQQAWRAAVKYASQRWGSTLTDAQRLQWTTWALKFPRKNSVGCPIHMTGANAYSWVNTYARWFVSSHTDVPPDPALYAYIQSLSFAASVAATQLDLTFALDPATVDTLFAVFMSRPLSAGRSAPDGTWSMITKIDGSYPNPWSIWAPYVARYGTPSAGQKTFWRAWAMRRLNYIPSPYLTGFFTWGA